MTHFCKLTLLCTLAMVSVFGTTADAQIIVDDFALTATSVLFSISGTLPNELPGESATQDSLYFVNPDVTAEPGFALGNFVDADIVVGSLPLNDSLSIRTGGTDFGDYFVIVFDDSFVQGESIVGDLEAKWNQIAFNPDEIQFLNVQWGTGVGDTLGQGVQLTNVSSIPEPSSLPLSVLGVLCFMSQRRKRGRQVH